MIVFTPGSHPGEAIFISTHVFSFWILTEPPHAKGSCVLWVVIVQKAMAFRSRIDMLDYHDRPQGSCLDFGSYVNANRTSFGARVLQRGLLI